MINHLYNANLSSEIYKSSLDNCIVYLSYVAILFFVFSTTCVQLRLQDSYFLPGLTAKLVNMYLLKFNELMSMGINFFYKLQSTIFLLYHSINKNINYYTRKY